MPKSDVLERLFALDGKAALITGSSSGIGQAMAVGFAEAGAKVGVHGSNREKVNTTLRMIEEKGGEAVGLVADLRDHEVPARLASEAKEKLGSIDILVNNAGMNIRQPTAEVTPEAFETIMTINLRSILFLCQAVYPMMKEQGGGKIINTGSMTTIQGIVELPVYGMTKSAVGQFTKTIALEWAPDNIQVNCIGPGFIRTPLNEKFMWQDPKKSKFLHERIPAKRPGTPTDLVGLALMLASHASDYITGQTIMIDGGFSAGTDWREA